MGSRGKQHQSSVIRVYKTHAHTPTVNKVLRADNQTHGTCIENGGCLIPPGNALLFLGVSKPRRAGEALVSALCTCEHRSGDFFGPMVKTRVTLCIFEKPHQRETYPRRSPLTLQFLGWELNTSANIFMRYHVLNTPHIIHQCH